MKFTAAFLIALYAAGFVAPQPTPDPRFPDIKEGLCGPARVIQDHLEGAGFRFETFLVSSLAVRTLRLTYLANPERVRAKKLFHKEYSLLWVERVDVIHVEGGAKHPKGWDCIESVTTISPSKLKALAAYFNEVTRILGEK